jgi:hypothetical protein
MNSYFRTAMITLFLSLFLVFCDKNDHPDNGQDPANLVLSVLSVDDDSGLVTMQATADNTVEFKLLIDNIIDPVDSNSTGYFEYNFGEGESQHVLTVRAYGESGRYIKASREVSIAEVPDVPVPLDSGYFSPLTYEGYTLAWQDEFNGSSVNTNDWTFETGAGGWGNNELQYYRPDNATVGEEVLTIEARKEDYGGSNYTSARMITKNKVTFKYGRVDIRALLPEGQGIWPALWTLGNDISLVGWPKCGEIDIMEMIGGSGRENTTYGTAHWDDANSHASYGGSKTLSSGTYNDKYHVFSIIWDETYIKWYVDNVFFVQIDITPAELSEFHKLHFFIFNLAVGGNWPGYPNASTEFPQQLKVDYIRLFEKDK